MQSSTSCDHEIEEYDDSHTQSSISPNFLNNNNNQQQQPSTNVGPFCSTMFHPLSNYFHPSQTTPLPNTNLDTMWSKPVRSEPNQTDLNSLLPISSSSSLLQKNQIMNQYNNNAYFQFATNCHTVNDQAHNNTSNNNVVENRNSKKRSRASKRAPTTVLTTDTANFRAMVQEFTGIPAESPPFTASSHFRTRLDLFASSTITPPSYNLLHPFAQKIHQLHHPFPPSSSIHNKLSSSVDHLKHPLNNINIFNMQNQKAFTFQTIHQTPQKQKYPLGNSSALVSKTQVPSLEIPQSTDSHLKIGNVLEESGILRHDDRVNLSNRR